jgi:hypothetical protein
MTLDPLNANAIRRETTPALMSLYLPIALDVPGVPAQMTGVFVPDNYLIGKTIDLLVYLRGYDVNRPGTATSVNQYWNSPQDAILRNFMLREEVNKSGKNVILAVPTLGPFAEFGKLDNDTDAKEFLDRILDGLFLMGPHVVLTSRPTIRHLILAAHSGGGVALRRLAKIYGSDSRLKGRLKDCWGFDCIYGVKDKDADFWADWAREHPDTRVFMFYIFTQKAVGRNPREPVGKVGRDPKKPIGPDNPYDHDNPFDHYEPTNTTMPAMELDRLATDGKLGNVAVVRESGAFTLVHNEVPRAHLATLLNRASYLDDR